jgi:hypothetical protein
VTGDTRIPSIVTWSPRVTNNVSMFAVESNQRASKRIKRRARQLAATLGLLEFRIPINEVIQNNLRQQLREFRNVQ